MEYFISHIGYILIFTLFLAALALFWGFMSVHNAKKRTPEMQEKQDRACESCALASMCSRIGCSEEEEGKAVSSDSTN